MSRTRTRSRQDRIVQILVERGRTTVRDLAAELAVSGWTLRRDLAELEERQLIVRHHGAVSLASGARPELLLAMPPAPAGGSELDALQRIGRAAADLLASGERVALGAGRTTTQVARALRGRRSLTVVTNGLNIALELAADQGIEVLCTGGAVDGRFFTLTGPMTERALRSHYFDVAVIGVSGVSAEAGLTVNSPRNAVALELMIDHALRVVVVADHSKLGRIGFARLAPLDAVDTLVTDERPPDELCDALRDSGVELVVAGGLR
ncbi:MAG: DeoR/GlpR family DNA-binding transcription regulator [Chloroflexota bacterium]